MRSPDCRGRAEAHGATGSRGDQLPGVPLLQASRTRRQLHHRRLRLQRVASARPNGVLAVDRCLACHRIRRGARPRRRVRLRQVHARPAAAAPAPAPMPATLRFARRRRRRAGPTRRFRQRAPDRVPEPRHLAQSAPDRRRDASAGRCAGSGLPRRRGGRGRDRSAARPGAPAGDPTPSAIRTSCRGGEKQRVGIARALASRARFHGLRRGRLGARRVGAGRGAQPAARPARRAGRRLPVHQPRYRRDRPHRRPRRRHVPRHDRGGGRRSATCCSRLIILIPSCCCPPSPDRQAPAVAPLDAGCAPGCDGGRMQVRRSLHPAGRPDLRQRPATLAAGRAGPRHSLSHPSA